MQRNHSYYISIPLSNHAINHDIQAAIAHDDKRTKIPYTAKENMHITICHLGNSELSRENIQRIQEIVRAICEKHDVISLKTTGVMDFGSNGTFGKLMIDSAAFNSLQAEIIDALKASGFSPSPLPCHISIARQPGNFQTQQPFSEAQKRTLQFVTNKIGAKNYDHSLIDKISFFDGGKLINYFHLRRTTHANERVMGISIFNVIPGKAGLIQFHFETEKEAKKFLEFAQTHFNDRKSIVSRKDQPTVIRLSPEQSEELLRLYPDELEKHRTSITKSAGM